MSVNINASTTNGLVLTSDTSGELKLQANGADIATVDSTGIAMAAGKTLPASSLTGTLPAGTNVIFAGTAVASTSGTSIDFTSIPSWVKRITLMFQGVSLSGSSSFLIQLGTGAGPTFTTSGYVGGGSRTGASAILGAAFTTGFGFNNATAAVTYSGNTLITNISSNNWCASGVLGGNVTEPVGFTGGSIALGGTLTAIRITTVNGTDTFDAGSINILYE